MIATYVVTVNQTLGEPKPYLHNLQEERHKLSLESLKQSIAFIAYSY